MNLTKKSQPQSLLLLPVFNLQKQLLSVPGSLFIPVSSQIFWENFDVFLGNVDEI